MEPIAEEQQTTAPQPVWLLPGIIGFCLLLLIPPAFILADRAFSKEQTDIVSPIAQSLPQPSGSPVIAHSATLPTPLYSPSDYLATSQKYFSDAQMLSQNRQQTDDEKREILTNLQKAIDTISEGITTYPDKTDLLIQRANFYMAIKTIAPQAEQLAMKDIQTAQRIAQHSSNSQNPPNLPKGLELVRDEQAMTRDVVVAVPDEAPSPYVQTSESSASSGTAIIPAGQTELTVDNSFVTDASPVYIVPMGQTDATLSVTSKTAGVGFTVALDNIQKKDVSFQYWVTK